MRRDVRRERPVTDSVVDHIADFRTPSGEVMQREQLAALERALDRMPDDYREVVTLSRLGRSEGATRMLLHRALARLGLELSD